jgi:hypothetical protein
MAAITFNAACRRMQLRAQVRTVLTACRKMLDAYISGLMQRTVAEAGNVRPRQPRSTPPEVAAEQSNSSTKRFDLPAPDVLVRRLGVSFGFAQLIHDGDVPRALCAPVSARFAGGRLFDSLTETNPPIYPVRCTRPFQCTRDVPGRDVPGKAGLARAGANRVGQKRRPKRLILRGLWGLSGRARTEKNG